MANKAGVGDILRHKKLLDQLREAARVLDIARHPSLAANVREAIEVIQALPYAEDIHAALFPLTAFEPKRKTGERRFPPIPEEFVVQYKPTPEEDHDGSTLD